MRNFSRTPGIVITLLFVAAGCSAESADAGSQPAAETAAPATPAAESAAIPAPLSDPEIAHVAVTANTIDVDMAHLAEDRTSNSAVLDFARTMITDHTAVNERAAALAQRLGVTPADNAVSRSLQSSADEARQRLSPLRGDAFDRAYIEREVAYHQAVLDALDGVLIPQSTNQELRGLLQEVRPAIAAHLGHAQELQDSLEGR